MKYPIDQLKTFNVAVNCKTKTDFLMMKNWLSSEGVDCNLQEIDWADHGENTCIVLFQNRNDVVGMASKDYYERRGLDIVTASEQFSTRPRPTSKKQERKVATLNI